MTLDTPNSTPGQESQDTTAAKGAGRTRRPGSRRVTRVAAPPSEPMTPTVEPDPTSETAGERASDTRTVASGAALTPGSTLAAPGAAARTEKPVRRSRRATRPVSEAVAVEAPADTEAPVADSAPAVPETPVLATSALVETVAEPGAAAEPASTEQAAGRRPVLDVLSEFGLSLADVVAPDPEVTETVPKRRTRASAKASEQVTDVSGVIAALDEQMVARESGRKSGAPRRSSRAAAPAADAASAETVPPAPEPVAQPVVVEPVASDVVEPVTKPKRTRATRSTAAAQAANAAPAEVPAAPMPVAEPAEAPRTASPPRLATTALLFQAPDPAAAPRRSRRAQSPAGPPQPSNDAEASDQPALSNHRGRQDESITESVDLVLPVVEPVTFEDMSVDDRGAVKEIEVIEAELTAEGAELFLDEFGPEDYVETDELATVSDEDGSELDDGPRRRRRRGGRGRRRDGGREDAAVEGAEENVDSDDSADAMDDASDLGDEEDGGGSGRRRRRRRRSGRGESAEGGRGRARSDEVTALKGSTRLEAKRQRRREGRDAGRRRQIITEAEFLARREAVERSMVVRELDGRTQIGVLEDGVLVEHYVSQQSQAAMAGNVYLGRVQNVLPSMEAAFIDVGKGRNAVLYAGEVNWDAAGLEGQPRRIEQALKSGDSVLVQVTKDPIGHKGARLTSQITLAGRYLVLVPGGGMTGISRKLPDNERARLKKVLRDVVPDGAGVIVRTAAEGASEDELRADVERLQTQWAAIEKKAKSASAPALLQGEPDLAIRVVRDIFNDDFTSLVVQGAGAWEEISTYVGELAPDLRERVSRWTLEVDLFTAHRVDEQLAKGMDRKVWLPSGGSLVIDRTEAMTVIDVNTGKFTGSGGTLEETVTRNNLEAAEEIVRQLRLRDIGGIIVIDFIDMVLESNRDLVLRRLVECLGRDRTRHQVAEVTSLGLVQMTRKRVGQGLVEAFSETCEHCNGRGFIVHTSPIEKSGGAGGESAGNAETSSKSRSRRKRAAAKETPPVAPAAAMSVLPDPSSEAREAVKATLATIAAAAAHAHDNDAESGDMGMPSAVTAEAELVVPEDTAAAVLVEPLVEAAPVEGVTEAPTVDATADGSATRSLDPVPGVDPEDADPATGASFPGADSGAEDSAMVATPDEVTEPSDLVDPATP